MPNYQIISTYDGYEIYDDGVPIGGLEVPKAERMLNTHADLLKSLKAALEWIDAVPSSVVLPTMPGFDRDSVDVIIAEAEGKVR